MLKKEVDEVIKTVRKSSGQGLSNLNKPAGTVNTGGPQDKYQNELIVKGLAFAATDDQIWEHFENYGEVSSLN